MKLWINKFSTNYYYYYIGEAIKIPILNFILYLDEMELLKTYLTLISSSGESIKLLFEKDEFGFSPF